MAVDENQSRLPRKLMSTIPLDDSPNKIVPDNHVINEWFVNMFMSLENTSEIEVVDYKLETLVPRDGHHTFTILKHANINLLVKNKPKKYYIIIKVVPTDDRERYTQEAKFSTLLKFSKEVQIYQQVIRCMVKYDEKRYPSAFINPPVPKCFYSQQDAQNDVIVLEDLTQIGYCKYKGGTHLNDLEHCCIVLRRMAHFHVFSNVIQRDVEMRISELFPFVVDAANFRETYEKQLSCARDNICKYLLSGTKNGEKFDDDDKEVKTFKKIDRWINKLFWHLVALRAPPSDRRLSVMIHGKLDLRNILFLYDGEKPISAKFIDFSTLTFSSPAIDISYFMYSAVHPDIWLHHYATLLEAYHTAHTETIQAFGMHGYELEMNTFINDYIAKVDHGRMVACLLRPALFVLHNINDALPSSPTSDKTNPDQLEKLVTNRLKIDSASLLPMKESKLQKYLTAISESCACPCRIVDGKLDNDSLDWDLLLKELTKTNSSSSHGCKDGPKHRMKQVFSSVKNSKENAQKK